MPRRSLLFALALVALLPAAGRAEWYQGDLHQHVTPPDRPGDVFATLERFQAAARREGIDFAVLTPHIWESRARGQRDAQEIAAWLGEPKTGHNPPLVIRAIEHTRSSPGHIMIGFLDERAFAEEIKRTGAARPLALRLLDRGALVFLNHPMGIPERVAFFHDRFDPSWKPLTRPEAFAREDPALRAEAEEILARCHGFEVLNRSIAFVERLTGTPRERTHLDKAFCALDREVLRQRRRMVGIGGSDNHAVFFAGATWVDARALTADAIREAILAGRVVVGGKAATALRATTDRAPGGGGVGANLPAEKWVELRFPGRALVWRDGELAGEFEGVYRDETLARAELHIYRIAIGDSWSNHVYVNLAER